MLTTVTSRHALDTATLQRGPALEPQAPAPIEISLNEEPAEVGARWNTQIANGWRSPFQEVIPTPKGGRVSYLRSLETDAARLMRTGGGMRAQPAPRAPGPVSYRRWLALHPTGQQAYLIPWPHHEVIALDPDSLMTGWRLDLGEPALGLFIDKTGQYLVGETGGSAESEQLLDYSGDPILADEGTDPAADPGLAEITRPEMTHTFIIDLENQVLVARLPGTYMRFIPLEDVALIATTRAIARLPLKEG